MGFREVKEVAQGPWEMADTVLKSVSVLFPKHQLLTCQRQNGLDLHFRPRSYLLDQGVSLEEEGNAEINHWSLLRAPTRCRLLCSGWLASLPLNSAKLLYIHYLQDSFQHINPKNARLLALPPLVPFHLRVGRASLWAEWKCDCQSSPSDPLDSLTQDCPDCN